MSRVCLGTALGLALLAACNSPVPNPQPNPGADWEIFAAPGGSGCGCPSARRMFIRNLATYERSVTLREYENYVFENGSRNYPRAVDNVPGGAQRFLTCSPEPSTTAACGIEYSWKFERFAFHLGSVIPLAEERRRGGLAGLWDRITGGDDDADQEARAAALLQGETVSRPTNSCVATCTGNSADCLRVDVRPGSGEVGSALYSLLAGVAVNGTVKVDDALRAIGESANVCDRSDIVVQAGRLSNTGKACTWAGGTPLDRVSLVIPEHLAGEVALSAGTPDQRRLSLVFPRATLHGPELRFSDRDLNADFGGFVSRADEAWYGTGTTRGRFVVLNTGKSCVALRTR